MKFKIPLQGELLDLPPLKLRNDIPAGVVVFLITLPLCLGVALASGAPLFSGIISGIIGGILVGLLSGSQTSVSGPAAGLTAVVFSSIAALDSFEVFLTAVIIAGILQMVLGFLKAGSIANYVPSNVIKGLLAAIGIILILKQIPHAIGYDMDEEEDFSFIQHDGQNTFSELFNMINFITPGAVVVSLVSILIMILWENSVLKKIGYFPSTLFVVLLGVALNYFFGRFIPDLKIESSHLVNIPALDFANLKAYVHIPEFSYLRDHHVFVAGLTIALVASLESLINIEAVDKLDPHKRESPPNRELIAQGIGNITAGLLGGIPITVVVVRSSVNIQAQNKTKLSTILNGVLMLVSVLLLADFLNLIPLASLAAILIITGYRLTRVTLFKEMFNKGWNQFIPFVTTIIAIVFTDLLIGVVIGLLVSIFFLMLSKYRNPFKVDKIKLHIGDVLKLELATQVSFFNKAAIKEKLWQVPEKMKVIIDATRCEFIDQDVLEVIEDFKNTVARERGISLNIFGLKEKYEMRDQVQFINVLDKATQQNLRPSQVLDLLKEGNKRFLSGKRNEKYYKHQLNATSTEQNPMAIILSCMDSRATPEIIFDSGIGDLLVLRIAGNVINTAIVASIELAVNKMGVRLVVVMAHSNCGAVNAAIHGHGQGNLKVITSKIDLAIAKFGTNPHINMNDGQIVKQITWQNAKNSLSDIIEASGDLKQLVARNELRVVAAYYDTSTGGVSYED